MILTYGQDSSLIHQESSEKYSTNWYRVAAKLIRVMIDTSLDASEREKAKSQFQRDYPELKLPVEKVDSSEDLLERICQAYVTGYSDGFEQGRESSISNTTLSLQQFIVDLHK